MELLDNMPSDEVERHLWCLRQHPEPAVRRDYHSPAFPELLYRAFCKARVPAAVQGRIGSPAVLNAIKPGDIVYVWPDFDLSFIKRAQDRGAIVVAERTNVMAPMGREALTRAYARRGLSLPAGWYPPRVVALELEQMTQCDFVVARNAFVSQSLRAVGIPQSRIIEGSYGYSPKRLASAIGIERPARPPVFAFVGAGIIGKGLDVLLEAWDRARVHGTLVLAGELDSEMQASYSHILARTDVSVLGFVRDVASVYAAADVFVFPSHVEGGPQVVYEAAGCGLPSIISAMGAGRLVRHEAEGLLIDPLDVDDLTAALRRLAENRPLRQTLGSAAAERAREFTWSKVGRQFYEQFQAIRRNADSSASLESVARNRS
jgi:glycosyltransferase involved in cell wall biosynthesis